MSQILFILCNEGCSAFMKPANHFLCIL